MPEPFAISIPEREIEDLQDRLARTRWPDAITGAGWSQGTDLAFLEQLMRHWQHDYDWRTHEKALNAFSHYRAPVDGLSIHFIHERGKGPNPMPLLLGHGCFIGR
jgi:epoxide hydrolase